MNPEQIQAARDRLADGDDLSLVEAQLLLDAAEQLARLRERLERLRPLDKAANKAPWSREPDGIDEDGWSKSTVVAATDCTCKAYIPIGGVYPSANLALIVAARNAIAEMLRETKP